MLTDSKYEVSVVIVSYNTRELTLKCLRDLSVDLHELACEIFLVDNGSVDGTVEAVKIEFPQVDCIALGYNAGFGAANNVALRMANGEFALLLNTDAFLKPGAMAAMLSAAKLHPRAAAIGPRLLNADGSLQKSCYKFPSPWRAFCEHTLLTASFPNNPLLGDYRSWQHDVEREVEFVIGACMLVRRSAILDAGVFDEAFFMYSEETDWCRRFYECGWSVWFTPKAEVVHLNGSSGKRQADQVFNEFRRGAETYMRKHHGSIGLFIFRLCLTFGAIARIAVFALLSFLPSQAKLRRMQVKDWLRILRWNLGERGAGLAPCEKVYSPAQNA